MSLEISHKIARRFLLIKQFLLPARSVPVARGVSAVFQSLRAIQYDPLNPCGRNADLVLQARIKGYQIDDYSQWLYKKRKGIEGYDKELCIVPIEDARFCRFQERAFLHEHKADIVQLMRKIKKEGPLCSQDLYDDGRRHEFWGTAPWRKVALEYLWRAGKIVIAYRKGGRKYYYLPGKIYPHLIGKLTSKKLSEDHVVRRLQSVGMLPLAGTGSGWLGLGKGKDVAPIISGQVKKGLLKEVRVEGVKRPYVIRTSDMSILKRVMSLKRISQNISFLGPLDNLLWDRKMIQELFAFDYKWEVYTPAHDRKHGYYVLPILYGDTFIGRIEPFFRKDGVLEIKGFWLEKDISWNKSIQKAFDLSLKHFQKYTQAKEIVWTCSKPKVV